MSGSGVLRRNIITTHSRDSLSCREFSELADACEGIKATIVVSRVSSWRRTSAHISSLAHILSIKKEFLFLSIMPIGTWTRSLEPASS